MSILEISHLSKKFGEQFANRDVSLNIEAGDVYGLIGKNGAGKSTLIKQIIGCVLSDGGTIRWDSANGGRIKIGVAVSPDKINKSLTALETLYLYGNSVTDFSKDDVNNILKQVGLYDDRNKKVGKYSTGMVQKLILAIALIGEPNFLVLDEPLNGLDPSSVRDIRDLLLILNREKNVTMIVSSHILGELAKLSTRYGLMAGGRLIKEFRASDIENLNDDAKELYILHALEELA